MQSLLGPSSLEAQAELYGMQNCLAKAIFDNIAEAPDELAFRKGDVLTVLEQNTNGLEGWWLCSLRGRQGICPGNRLRLLAGVYDSTSTTTPPVTTQVSKRRSWNVTPNKVITPHKVGDVYVYDVPPKSNEEYDVPPSRVIPVKATHFSSQSVLQPFSSYDFPRSHSQESCEEPANRTMAYDVPRPHSQSKVLDMSGSHTPYDVPRCRSQEGSVTSRCSVSDLSCGSVIANKYEGHEYDVPDGDCSAYDIPAINFSAYKDTYDIPQSHSIHASNRSSGVSMLSTGSSAISPSSSASSLTASLSLSSLAGTNSNRSSLEQQQHEMYDIPPSEPKRVADSSLFRTNLTSSIEHQEMYDTPQSNQPFEFYDTPKPRLTILKGTEGVYDVPPQVTKDVSYPIGKTIVSDEVDGKLQRLSLTSSDNMLAAIQGKELPLDLDAAMDTLVRLQQEVQTSISKLFGFVSATWRRKEYLENKIYDIKLSCTRIKASVQEFVDFANGALANSARAPDRTLCPKLYKLVKPIQDSNCIIQKTTEILDKDGWSIGQLMMNSNSGSVDELDQLVACCRGLTEDVRQVASFIQGNSKLIFKRSQTISSHSKGAVQERPLPVPPGHKLGHVKSKDENVYENDTKDWIEDYDYVNLESKESVEKENEEIKAALPKELRKSFENILKESEVQVNDNMKGYSGKTLAFSKLDPNDKQVIQFYHPQVETHITYLTNAIDAFLATIENNQPPKVFIGHSKFVVLSAHKLVYIGDTVHRNIVNIDIRNKLMLCANALCEALKITVQSTKTAALQFPSVIAVQEMVDSVVDVSHTANDLKLIFNQAAKL